MGGLTSVRKIGLAASTPNPALKSFNNRLVSNPDLIAACGNAKEIESAIRAGMKSPKVAVRSGGHCFEDFVALPHGGVLLDLAPNQDMERISKRTFRVASGVRIGRLYSFLRQHKLTLPGGSCWDVGVGGHITGGGYGVLSRKYGLISDYLSGVSLTHVTASGQVVTEIYDDGPVVWAHQGGGGGNFGVVNDFFLSDLPPEPKQVYVCRLVWSWSTLSYKDFEQIVRTFGSYFEGHSSPDDSAVDLHSTLNFKHRDSGKLALSAFDLSNAERLRDYVQEMYNATKNPPLIKTRQLHKKVGGDLSRGNIDVLKLPWKDYESLISGSENLERVKLKSAYMRKSFPLKQIETLYKYLHESPLPPSAARGGLHANSYGGAVNRIQAHETAVPQRDSILKLQYWIFWPTAAGDKECMKWLSNFYKEMYDGEPLPDQVMDGCFVNYCDKDLREWERLYYKDNYPKLQQVKNLLDPLNVFHHSQSIRPSRVEGI